MLEALSVRPTSAQLAARCLTASQAYQAAGHALDVGLRRKSGATALEWKAEYDARIDLRIARAAYVAAANAFTAVSAAEHHALRRAVMAGHGTASMTRPRAWSAESARSSNDGELNSNRLIR